ncbi:cytochrome b-c1 complex subunit 7-like [Paramacrobiotus metropolitanus]|uniref:cytochrome b-c1 complex subunit 7-like n=1 Tax=Paramacrobiotus metropolitanus TaxID=2943436 RepID=UPI00244622B5|nr:cytochrome b-c1 complex subunit 7-like [Paramacrobiotus metropolitanus]
MAALSLPTKTTPKRVADSVGLIYSTMKKWIYQKDDTREYGLYHDDLYRDGHDDVREAVRRLPAELFDARAHRLHRAIQLSRNKIVLPEQLWTKYDDPGHHYLTPYLNEVIAEKAERAAWNKK